MTTDSVLATHIENFAAIAATMENSTAESTRVAYASAQRGFMAYCTEHGWSPVPTDENDVGNYLARVLSYLRHKADTGASLSTINKILAGLKYHAAKDSFLASAALMTSRDLRAFTSGLARQRKADTIKQAEAFTVPQIKKIHTTLQKTSVRNMRNRALLALGIATALRAQSLADLNLGDVSTSKTIDGIDINVRWSKTDQQGKGRIVPVAAVSGKKVDPVAAVNTWMKYLRDLGFTDTDPLFPHVRGASVQKERLGSASDAITDMVRGVVVQACITTVEGAKAYSSHSLRSTFITLSQQAGVPEHKIAAITGHKNMLVLRGYDRTSVEAMAQVQYLGA
jgi:integrase